ncbi:MAG: NAD-dependent epimerase/dehydratase family protein, partial [Chlamydiota bacterium]|nr:NAD-dependent epimerase/dehydratase family protein [Chlamydiota bacterium]
TWSIANNIKFMYASSAATYGQGENGFSDDDKTSLCLKPMNVYGFSKYLFDLWVLRHQFEKKFTAFKFFNVFGPNEHHKSDMMSVIAKSFHQVKNDKKIRLFKSHKPDYADGEQKRDFIYIKDVVDMMYFFVKNPEQRGIYNIGTGNARTWNELSNALFHALNIKPCVEYIDMPIDLMDKYQYFTQADLSKLRQSGCQHQCMSLETSVSDYVHYLQNDLYL